jgi:uncharacterized phage protein gp47/JayE
MRQIPNIVDIQESLKNDFINKLNLSNEDLKYVLNAFNMVISAQFKLVYLYLSDIQNNVYPDTADIEGNGGTLERLGRIYLNRNPKPATPGIFEIEVTGTIGGFLRSGLTFKSNEDSKNPGQVFVLDNDFTLVSATGIIEVRSIGGGTEYDLNLGDKLTITEPVIGVTNIAEVVTIINQPLSSENIEDYRQAILDAIQLEPNGGAKTDYRLWAADAQGVRKVYPYVRNNNAGIVDVYVEASETDSIDGLGTPSASILNDVRDVIEFDPDNTKPLNERGRRPIQAIIYALPIVITPVDVQIIGLQDSSTAVRNSIESNLITYLKTVRPYVAGGDLARNKNDVLYSGRVQSIATDVLESSNFFTDFIMQVNGVTVSNYEFNLGFIPYLRNLTFL